MFSSNTARGNLGVVDLRALNRWKTRKINGKQEKSMVKVKVNVYFISVTFFLIYGKS